MYMYISYTWNLNENLQTLVRQIFDAAFKYLNQGLIV